MTFDKIRKNEIHDKDFNEICEEIKNYDIEIYTKYMQLKNIENENNENGEQEIIDGQQRITSLFLLLRAIYTS